MTVTIEPRPINADVSLFVQGSGVKEVSGVSPDPNFHIGVQSFNMPVNMSVNHLAYSPPSVLYIDVETNVAPVSVALDSLFQGTFVAHTSWASATVSGAMVGRTLDYDVISDSEVTGWIGNGTRPETEQLFKAGQGHVAVASSLANVTLVLGP